MQQLDPKAKWLFFIQSLLTWIFLFFFFGMYLVIGIVTVFTQSVGMVLFICLLALLFCAGISYLIAHLSWTYYRYELHEDGFKKEYGIIWKKYVTIPYDRIQNVDIYRGLIARLLGLSDLHVQTAGMSGNTKNRAEGRLPGLSHADAEKMRDELVRRVKGTKQGL